MTREEVNEILRSTNQDQWIVDDNTGTFTYANDLCLRIERADFETYNDFHENWATSHPDSHAMMMSYTVYYNSSLVLTKNLVSVDGFRATLPMPMSATDLRVRRDDVNFAKIINIGDRVDEYLQRSGLTIV